MTFGVFEGHISSLLGLIFTFFLDIFFVENLIISKLSINGNKDH